MFKTIVLEIFQFWNCIFLNCSISIAKENWIACGKIPISEILPSATERYSDLRNYRPYMVFLELKQEF